MALNGRHKQDIQAETICNDSCRAAQKKKSFILVTVTLTLLSLLNATIYAQESIYDEAEIPKAGTIDRASPDNNSQREANIIGVKYEFIEVSDELNDLIANPEKIEEIKNSQPTKTATKEPKITPVKKASVIKPKTTLAKPEKNNITPPVVSKPVVSKSLKLLPQTTKEPTIKALATTKPQSIYNKYSAKGKLLGQETKQWSCVHDTENGLMWEVKSNDNSMRNSNNLYSWYKSDELTTNGIANGGRCQGSTACDTKAYIQAMNKQNYCGYSDWQLPTRKQMQTLVNLKNEKESVKIDTQYFPETVPSWYWTASEHNNNNNFAWYIMFRNGVALNDLKERPKHIRLVRKHHQTVSQNSYQ